MLKGVYVLVILCLIPVLAASVQCGDLVCVYPTEDNSTCAVDCCSRNSDGVCMWYSQCGNYDPDCCSGDCFSDRFMCQGNEMGTDCFPGKCVAGPSCDNTCTSHLDCSSDFCGTSCSESCVENVAAATDLESCCECWNAGTCEACSTTQVVLKSLGFGLYQGKDVIVNMELDNNGAAALNIWISVSGPLTEWVTLEARDTEWTGSGFSYIGSGAAKYFQVIISGIPDHIHGFKQVKVSGTYSGGEFGEVVPVVVLPVLVAEQGRTPPTRVNVGTSRFVTNMRVDDYLVPVELVMSTW